MHKKWIILLVAVAVLVTTGLGFAGAGTRSNTNGDDGNPFRPTADDPSFGPVTFSSGYLEGMDVLFDTGQRFESGITTLYAQWPFSGVRDKDVYAWNWYLDGEPYGFYDAATFYGSAGKVTVRLESRGSSPLEPGTYELRVYTRQDQLNPDLTGEVTIGEPGASVPAVSLHFGPLTFSSDFDDDALEPVNTGEVFSEDVQRLYGYWPYSGLQVPQSFRYTWYHDGEVVLADDSEFPYESGDHWTWFDLPDGAALEPGTYELVITVDGENVLSGQATVEDAAAQPANTSYGSFGPLTFSSAFDEDKKEPVDTGESFPEDIQKLYAYWPYTGVWPPQAFQFTWYHNGKIAWQGEAEFPYASGTHRAWFAEPDGEALDPGTYELAIAVDGEVLLRGQAIVGDATVQPSLTGQGHLGPVTFSTEFNEDTLEPLNAGWVFSPGITRLYASWPFDGVPETGTYRFTWYHDGEVLSDEEEIFTYPSGVSWVWATRPDGKPLKQGRYELVVTVDGEEVLRKWATIENVVAQTPTVSPPPPFTPVSAARSVPAAAAVTACVPGSAAAPADWALVMCDTFDSNVNDWGTGPSNSQLASVTRTIVDGQYTWDIEAFQAAINVADAPLDPVTDFYVAVDARRVSGPRGDTQNGLQFRRQDADNYYMFLISDQPDFKVYHYNQGQWIALIDWTDTQAIVPGDSNRIAVKAIGPDFTFYINDQEVAQFTDDSIPKGRLKLVTQAAVIPGEETHAVVEFDNFEVRLPPEHSASPHFGPITFSSGFDDDAWEPVNTGEAFPEGLERLYGSWPLSGVQETDTFHLTWYLNGEVWWEAGEEPFTDREGVASYWTSGLDGEQLEPGTYELVVTVDGETVLRGQATIGDKASQPAVATPPSPSTPAPPARSVPTVTAEPTNAPSTAVFPADWQLVMNDTFDNNTNGWSTGPFSDQLATLTRTIVDGGYTWDVETQGAAVSAVETSLDSVTDLYIAVDGHRDSGPAADVAYGVQFRKQDADNFYMFMVSDGTGFALDHQSQGEWIKLIGWTQTDAIIPGGWNRVGVKAVGPDFTFYINGQQVAQFSDATIPQGDVRVATLFLGAAQAVVDFDNLEVRLPPGAAAEPTGVANSAAVSAGWPIAMNDTFDDNLNDWPTGPGDGGGLGTITRTIVDGRYTWEVEAFEGTVIGIKAYPDRVTDFYMAVDTHRVSGVEDSTQYGVRFRQQDDDNCYMFLISDVQTFKLYHNDHGQWVSLIDWTHSDAILPGGSNRIAVQAVGPNFTFYVNEQEIAQFTDDSIPRGTLMLASQVLPEAGTRAVFDFDNVEVRLPARDTVEQNSALRAEVVPAGWPVVISDTFDDNANGWITAPYSDQMTQITRTIAGGRYTWDVEAHEALVNAIDPSLNPVTDLYVAVDARRSSGPADDVACGVQFRRQDDDNFYLFTMSDGRGFSLDQQVQGEWVKLIDWTRTGAILLDGWNRVGVKAIGPDFTFYINGQEVDRFSDSSIPQGSIRVTSLFLDAAHAVVDFDNFEVRLPPETAAAEAACPPVSTNAPAEWPLAMCDTFETGANWITAPDSRPGQGAANRTILDGRYVWEFDTEMAFSTGATAPLDPVTDFYVAVDAHRAAGPADGVLYGMEFRHVDDRNYYEFQVSDARDFHLARFFDGQWTALIDLTPSEAVIPGAWNRIAVRAVGPDFTLFINDQPVGQISDDSIPQGRVNVTAFTMSAAQAVVDFDNFEMRPRPAGAEVPPVRPVPASELPVLADVSAGWSIVISDTFDNNGNEWATGPLGDRLGVVTRTISGGSYAWQIEAHIPLVDAVVVSLDPVTDFYAAVDARKVSGPEGDPQYGLQFRKQDTDNYFMFLVSDQQTFAVRRSSQGQETAVIDWTRSEAVMPGDWNRVAVRAIGPDFTLYINDQEVARFTDGSIPQGGLRLTTQGLQAGRAAVDFDNFEVRVPSASTEPEK